ncbi:MAG TPA: translation initiation factor IF-3, partial [Thermohalobaculum sp.]|nr:translation initiation factor IF-3 [Thermohalobaculum sp.]
MRVPSHATVSTAGTGQDLFAGPRRQYIAGSREPRPARRGFVIVASRPGRRRTGEDPIARRPHHAPPTRDTGPRVNGAIRAPQIRLIDHDGDMIGVVSPARGVEMAEEVGLDLVEISPNADPPVCKIM